MSKYTITLNHHKKTYTIRHYDNSNKLIAKYRSNPQGQSFNENWTEYDIKEFLKKSNDYFIIK